MDELSQEIIDRISNLNITCPACEPYCGDEQYTCTVCWGQGGDGEINVLEWVRENKDKL